MEGHSLEQNRIEQKHGFYSKSLNVVQKCYVLSACACLLAFVCVCVCARLLACLLACLLAFEASETKDLYVNLRASVYF